MTEKRDIKIGNTFSVLQEDDQEPILEEDELPPITKIDKEEKKGGVFGNAQDHQFKDELRLIKHCCSKKTKS